MQWLDKLVLSAMNAMDIIHVSYLLPCQLLMTTKLDLNNFQYILDYLMAFPVLLAKEDLRIIQTE